MKNIFWISQNQAIFLEFWVLTDKDGLGPYVLLPDDEAQRPATTSHELPVTVRAATDRSIRIAADRGLSARCRLSTLSGHRDLIRWMTAPDSLLPVADLRHQIAVGHKPTYTKH